MHHGAEHRETATRVGIDQRTPMSEPPGVVLPPSPLAAGPALAAVSLRAAGEYQAARELAEDILARRRCVLGDEHPETMMAGAFDLILRGLDIGGESPWMAALREASRRRQQEARELNEDKPG